MRNPEDLSTEDRQRVEEYTRTGIHSVERKPFRPWLMMLMLLVVVTLLSVIAVVLEKLYIP
jgi:cell division protein FtsX